MLLRSRARSAFTPLTAMLLAIAGGLATAISDPSPDPIPHANPSASTLATAPADATEQVDVPDLRAVDRDVADRAASPGAILDLSRWKLQLPVDANGSMRAGCAVAEIKPPGLATYASQWFSAVDGGVVFRASTQGCRTPNTKYARSELRELTANGRNAAWLATSGTHTMSLRQAITRLPGTNGRVVAAQVHDGSDGTFQIKIDHKQASNAGTVGLCYELLTKTKGCLDRSYVLGTPYDLTVTVSAGRIRVEYNGVRAIDAPYTRPANYFKVGSYLQTAATGSSGSDGIGEVVVTALSVSHEGGNTAAPTRPVSQPYYLTGYSYWDNTPPGSAVISHPVLHDRAGGTGTYDDPVTVAVGHAITGGQSVPLYAPGTRFYLVSKRRYLIVEDTCGDGPKPQQGPCYRLPTRLKGKAVAWLDVWVDGQAAGRAASDRCMSRLTGVTRVIKDPPPGLPVRPGPLC